VAIDAGGVVAARTATRRNYGTLLCAQVSFGTLQPLIRTVESILRHLDGLGRAAVGLELRGAADLSVQWGSGSVGSLNPNDLIEHHRMRIGGDLAVPADDSEIAALADRWARELARAARLPIWEPATERVVE
jgi:hypothetical protein